MKRTKKCAFCGKEFSQNSGSQRYCCEGCAEKAKQQKKARQRDFLKATEPMMDIQGAEYLSFSKAAILMGCSRQFIYKLVAEKKLPASRISSRMSFIRRIDIEAMLAANPYHRILPGTQQKEAKKPSTAKKTNSSVTSCSKNETSQDEILDYISGEEVMEIYKVKRSWLYATAKTYQIPMCKINGKNYFCRKHMDNQFGVSAEVASLTEWLTPQEAADHYCISRVSIKSHAYRHNIPTKREYGQTFYSKKHLDEVLRPDLIDSEDYYTVEQVQELYGYTKANIHHIVKANSIAKVKVGVRNLLLKADVDRVMAGKRNNNQHPQT